MQFGISAQVLKAIFGLEGNTATIVAAFIVILYSSFGGIRAVTFTDIMQLFMFSAMIPLLGLIIWDALPTPRHIGTILATQPHFSFSQFINNPMQLITAMALMVYCTIPDFQPTTFQRISMAKNIHQVKTSYTYAAIFYIILRLLLIWISILLVIDNVQLNLTNNNLISHLMNHYTITGLKGLLAVGIMAMVMSTADSHINAAAVLMTHDIVQPLGIQLKKPMLLTRIFAAVIGSIGLGITFYMQDLLQIVLLVASFYLAIISPSFLLAIFGFRSSSRAVLIGMGAGFFVVCTFLIVFGPKIYSEIRVASGLLANVLAYMSSHYLLKAPGGWVGIQDKAPLIAARQARQARRAKRKQNIKNFRLWPYLQNLLPKQAISYILLGIYILVATFLSLYNLPEVFKIAYPGFYKIIRYGLVLMASSFITFPIWPPSLNTKPYITVAWPLAQFILCVTTTLLAFISGFDLAHTLILAFNLVVFTLLLRWYVSLAMILLCIPIVFICIHIFLPAIGMPNIETPVDIQLFIFLLIISIILMLYFKHTHQQARQYVSQTNFLKHHQQHTAAQLHKAEAHQERFFQQLDVDTIRETLKQVKEQLQQATQKVEATPKVVLQIWKATIEKLEATADYLWQVIYTTRDHLPLHIATIHIDTLLHEISEEHTLSVTSTMKPPIILQKHTQKTALQCDKVKIKQLIHSSISKLQTHNPNNHPITLIISDTQLGYTLQHMANYTKKIQALNITLTTQSKVPPINNLYMATSYPTPNAHTENDKIIDAHYGYMAIAQHIHTFVVPLDVTSIRPKAMEQLGKPLPIVPATPAKVEKLEKEFLRQLKIKTNIDLNLVHKAIAVIKTYHHHQKRQSGECFYTHPMQVACILLDYTQDQDTLITGLLHDTVEDTKLSLSQVKAQFNPTVSHLVSQLTNLEDNLKKLQLSGYEQAIKLIQTNDPRVIKIKLADRLHNMRTIGAMSKTKQRQKADETIYFYVPMAKKLNLTAWAECIKPWPWRC